MARNCRLFPHRLLILLIHWTILHTNVQFLILGTIIAYILLNLKSSSRMIVCVFYTTVPIPNFYKVYTYQTSTNMYVYLQIHIEFHHPNLLYTSTLLLLHSSYSSFVFVLFLFHRIYSKFMFWFWNLVHCTILNCIPYRIVPKWTFPPPVNNGMLLLLPKEELEDEASPITASIKCRGSR